ncbi:MAG: PLP-dependent aminotransferase family protein [Verrucomicrobia bacterium]|nr:PLP-dependent aminotransferase family protein [Verrucomicrobiota bacterium]
MKTALSQLGQRTAPPAISWLMSLTLGQPKLISLAAGFTDNASLPVSEARELLNEILSGPRTGQPALQYGSTAGDALLRELTAKRLTELDENATTAAVCDRRLAPNATKLRRPQPAATDISSDRLLITHGSQQLLYLLTEALCDPGDIVLVEDPTYFVYLGIAQSHGLRCRGVRLLPDGLDLAHLEQVLEELRRRGDLPRVKLLYLVTYYQNPTGYTTSFAKKAAALKLLRRYEKFAGHPLYLIEDAAYRELRFAGEEVPSALAAPGGADRVLYAGTFSKPFATGVRVGFGVLPEPIRTTATRIKGNHDFGTANLLQQLLARALATGAYERHLAELQRRYAHKARVMTDAIRAHFPANVEWREPAGGLYVWARAPKRLRTGAKSRFFQTALKRNVLYVPGALCYANDPTRRQPDHEMRLSYGGASERDLAEGIKRLGTVLSA